MALNPAGLVLRMMGQENAFRMELERCLRIRSRLSSCTRCIDACPEGALSIGKEGFIVSERCTLCGLCMAACPTGAIAVAMQDTLGAGFLTLNDRRRLLACKKRIDEAQLMARQQMQIGCLGMLFPVWLAGLATLGETPVTIWVGNCQECAEGQNKPWAFEGDRLHIGLLTIERGAMPENDAFEQQNQLSRRSFFSFLAGSAQKSAAKSVSSLLPKAKTSDPEAVLGVKRAVSRSGRLSTLQAWPELWRGLFLRPEIDAERCSACMVCSRLCPTKALDVKDVDGKQAFVFDPLKCLGCGMCKDVCFEKALSLNPCGLNIQEAELVRVERRRCAGCSREWLFAGERTLCPACVKKTKAGLL
jgi:formate hydrogenlyase subunit 6/NADH:ubiquinone oxidoreductase subunit I